MYYLHHLVENIHTIDDGREKILDNWTSFDAVEKVLQTHDIEIKVFRNEYAALILDYFVNVVSGTKEIGDCPVMAKFLDYLKNRWIMPSTAEHHFWVLMAVQLSVMVKVTLKLLKMLSIKPYHL